MRATLLAFTLLFSSAVFGQVGLTLSYAGGSLSDRDAYSVAEDEIPDIGDGFEAQVNYWFRLERKRVEFQPTLYYSALDYVPYSGSGEFKTAGFQLETNFYIFDFGGDCDCPTFGKQGPALEKGFFVQLAPGVARRWLGASGPANVERQLLVDDRGHTIASIAGGIGLDVGISNLVTVTPTATVRYATAFKNPVLARDEAGATQSLAEPNALTYQLGLQFSIRFDHKRY